VGLDIRLPIGLMFAILGVILLGYGVMSDPAIYARSLNLNVNIYWGVVMLLFGLVFLFLGRKGFSSAPPEDEPPEGPLPRRDGGH
jgi:hypothetical protein